jgi:ProP effector
MTSNAHQPETSSPTETATSPTTPTDRDHQTSLILADLAGRWPQTFAKPVPLAIGITKTLKTQLAGAFPARQVNLALARWTRRNAYLEAVARGDARRNLDGSETGFPDERHRTHARMELARRARKRKSQQKIPTDDPSQTAEAGACCRSGVAA